MRRAKELIDEYFEIIYGKHISKGVNCIFRELDDELDHMTVFDAIRLMNYIHQKNQGKPYTIIGIGHTIKAKFIDFPLFKKVGYYTQWSSELL